MKRLVGDTLEGDIEATPRQIVENMAISLGINMSDPGDQAAQLVEIGIIDADPSRVIKHCEHAFVSLAPNPPLSLTGMLAHTLGLPSVGPKVIHCDLHKHFEAAATLDSAYAAFKERYCDGCRDSAPRPPEWEYSDEWQRQENLRHLEFLEKFFRKGPSW
ncbi:MAG: hypothetical protein ACLQOO_18855 [Terriglobia bacterium]